MRGVNESRSPRRVRTTPVVHSLYPERKADDSRGESKHHIVNVRGMKVAELTELEDDDQTPPHIIEAHARIPQ